MSYEFNVYIRECKPLLHLSLMNESCISINQYIVQRFATFTISCDWYGLEIALRCMVLL